ncbi:MAG: hypothetical protein KGJ66_08080 [Alphaproteobacteria bacterium]|nr:hypothetical protein [Alphaproteobacteria bacterium]
MRLDPRFRAAVYIVFGVLFVTGVAWLLVDRRWSVGSGDTWQTASAYLLMVHGGAAMVFLLLLGAIISLHVPTVWRSRKNRASGTVMLVTNTLLIVSAFGLYYVGAETLRNWTSDLHIAIGFGMPAILVAHVILGRRSLRVAQRNTAGRVIERDGRTRLRRARAASLTKSTGEGR